MPPTESKHLTKARTCLERGEKHPVDTAGNLAQIAQAHALLAINDQLGTLIDVLAGPRAPEPADEPEVPPMTDEDGEEIAPQWMVVIRQKRTPGSALHPWMVHLRAAWSAEEAVNRLDIPPGAMAYAVQCQLVAEFRRDEKAPLRRLP